MFIESKRATSVANRVPRWRGFGVRSGEVWRLPAPPSGDAEPLLLVTDTAVVTLTPWDAPGGSRARVAAGTPQGALDFLSKVTSVSWAA